MAKILKRVDQIRTIRRYHAKSFRWFRGDVLQFHGECIDRGRADKYGMYAALQLEGNGIVIDIPIAVCGESVPGDQDYFEIDNDGVTETYRNVNAGHVVNDGADLRVMLIQAIGESNV